MTAALPSIDDVAAYWNRRPCNIRHSPKPLGSRDYFDDVEKRKYFVEPHIPGFADFQRWRGKKVLEIGCGIGTDAVNFARAGADYTDVELSAESLTLARKRFEIFGLRGSFHEGNAELLDRIVHAREFDLVYAFGVLHHTPEPRKALQAAREFLAPGGELCIMLYAKNSWKSMMIEAGLDQPEAQSGCPIAQTYSVAGARELLHGLFVPEEIRQDHIFPYVVEKYVRYEYEAQPWFRAMPREMFEALEKRLGWHMLIAAKPACGGRAVRG